ncbi:hypothetical protein AZI85_07830 [Bdellovibrio bacteriovorus]|uniref:Lipoprotein n=1 Tax=Bdellovibrio bacteriovorus TaxID=959 RepID=A0A150WGD0_BDEBC|nr:hypothetical protein [Bdellovibrio bacteriovorus]KYG62099.1 hypothetical protein AZI85_07830 [Bdellovibrio bacteriovorus]
MKYFRHLFIILISLSVATSCSNQENVLTEYASTDSDAALFLEAKKKIDDAAWDDAISIMTTQLSADYQARNDVKTSLMHAYGGKCGISFFDLVQALKGVSSTKMFEIALQIFQGQVTDVAACDNAVAVLMSIGTTAAQRTNDQNLFAAILGLTRMATTLKSKFDIDAAGLGDGVPDAGAEACTVSAAAGKLSDAEVDRIVTGVGLVFENLAALGDELTSGTAGDSFGDAQTLCQTDVVIPPIGTPQDHGAPMGVTWVDLGLPSNTPTYQDFGLGADVTDPIVCTTTQDADVTPKLRRIFRRMIESGTLGVGACDIADITVNYTMGSPPTISVNADCCPGMQAP